MDTVLDLTTPIHARAILPLGPSLYWPLSTDLLDDSGNHRDGASGGAGISLVQPGLLPDDTNGCALFDNSATAYIQASYGPFIVGSQRTFVGWAVRSQTGEYDVIWMGSGANPPFLFFDGASGLLTFRPSSSSPVTWADPTTVGVPFHWALTYNDVAGGRRSELFINGVSQGSQAHTVAGYISGSAGNFQLGQPGTVNTWGGKQQEVAVFERLLSAAEIAGIYANQSRSFNLQGFAGQLYDQLAPLAVQDPANGNALAHFLNAIGEMYEEVKVWADDDEDGNVGWSILLDLVRCPTDMLPWLGQFVGAKVDPTLSDANQRLQISQVQAWARGSLAAIKAAPVPYLTGTKAVIVIERDSAVVPANPAYGLTVYTIASETTDTAKVLAALLAVKPAGIKMNYATIAGWSYAGIFTTDATENVVYTTYRTYNGVRTNTPGS